MTVGVKKLENQLRWLVLANRTEAVFYAEGRGHAFRFVSRISNPQGHLLENQLDSDRSGRGFSSPAAGAAGHALDRRAIHHEKVAQLFAGKIARALEKAYREERFGKLVLVAEPHFLGLLRAALPDAVRRAVSHEVAREYIRGSDAEIQGQVLQAL